MTQEQWKNLNIGDSVSLIGSAYSQGLTVEEICEDEKSISKWREKGFMDVARICKFSGDNGFHTWDADYSKWSVNHPRLKSWACSKPLTRLSYGTVDRCPDF